MLILGDSVFPFHRGHGTYVENGEIKSSVVGVVKQINKLISVIPMKSKYSGEIGDVVVGRVTEIMVSSLTIYV